jgi:hypothetical protein
MPEFDFDSLKKEVKATIISQTYALIITKDIDKDGHEYITHYNRNDPCMSCSREMYGNGESSGCIICDKVMTEKELEAFLNAEKKTLKPSEIKEAIKKNTLETEIKKVADILNKTEKQIEELVQDKIKELKGLISKEGAIKLVRIDLGIDKFSKPEVLKKEEKDAFESVPIPTTTKIEASIIPLEPKKPQPKITIQKQFIPSFVMVFNGRQGSGKSTSAQMFPTPFILDLEFGKNSDSIKYSTNEAIKNLIIGTMEDIKNKKENIDIVSVQDKELKKTWDNINECIKWFENIGAKTHKTIVFDTAYWIRESRVAVEEAIKGRRLMKFDYRPITEAEEKLLYELIEFCRKYERNLILITHWTGKYQTIKNDKGYGDSELIGEIPDIKEWYIDAMTWKIDFLKPEESNFDKKYIIYLDKSPRYQYSKLDITNKNLFDIINNLESFEKEINEYKKLEEKKNSVDIDIFNTK